MKSKLSPAFWLNLFSGFNHAAGALSLVIISPLLLKSGIYSHFSVMPISMKLKWLGYFLALKPTCEAASAFVLSRIQRVRSLLTMNTCLILILVSLGLTAASMFYGNLMLLFIAQALMGLGASVIFLIETAITQLTPSHQLTRAFNSLEWAIGMGMLIGPILGSWVSHINTVWQPDYPYLLFSVVGLALFVIGARFVPLNALSAVDIDHPPAGMSWFDYLAWFCFMLGWHGYFHWFPALLIHHFSYSTLQLGHVFTYLGVLYVFCQFGIVRRFTGYGNKWRVVQVALPVVAICIACMAFVTSRFELFVLLFFYMLSISFLLPFWKSYLTTRYHQDPAKMFGTMTVITTACSILASALGGQLSSFSLTFLFVLSGAIVLLASLFLYLSAFFPTHQK